MPEKSTSARSISPTCPSISGKSISSSKTTPFFPTSTSTIILPTAFRSPACMKTKSTGGGSNYSKRFTLINWSTRNRQNCPEASSSALQLRVPSSTSRRCFFSTSPLPPSITNSAKKCSSSSSSCRISSSPLSSTLHTTSLKLSPSLTTCASWIPREGSPSSVLPNKFTNFPTARLLPNSSEIRTCFTADWGKRGMLPSSMQATSAPLPLNVRPRNSNSSSRTTPL